MRGTRDLPAWPSGERLRAARGIPHLFVARVTEPDTPNRKEGESIDHVFPYRFTELRRACERGEIVDSFTLAVVLRLAPHFDRDRFAWHRDAAPGDPVR